MDPLTHALLGATAAQVALGAKLKPGFPHAWVLGAVGGLLPDADILIRSSSDPLLAIEYHRHFTHAFAFIPIGGLIAASPWLMRKQHRANCLPIVAATTLGYATHGLLDACTNYGTQLLWPFSSLRVAWNLITTIGPPLTLALLIGLVYSLRRQSRLPALLALVFGLACVGSAAWQREQALTVQARIAALRGHIIDRAEMFPSVGNVVVWRSVYESDGKLYSDRIRMFGNRGTQWKPGSSITLVREQQLPADHLADKNVIRDFRRFLYFSDGWVARSPSDPGMIGDARYSLRTDTFQPIWGVRFQPGIAQPTEWVDLTARNRVPATELWAEIRGRAAGFQAPP